MSSCIVPKRLRPRIRAIARYWRAASPLIHGLRSYYHVPAHPTPHCIAICGYDYDVRPLTASQRERLSHISHHIARAMLPGWHFEDRSFLIIRISPAELTAA